MFGILFDGAYLLVDHLGAGHHATVQLVRHVKTGELFARKLTRLSHPIVLKQAKFEASKSPNIPGTTQLVASFLYPVTHSSGLQENEEAGHMAMIFEYVNGGNVYELVDDLRYQNSNAPWSQQKLPEHFIWKCMSDMIKCHLRLSLSHPYLTHRDGHEANWLLQWPDSAQEDIPTLTLGDFGLADSFEDIEELIDAVSDPENHAIINSATISEQIRVRYVWWYQLSIDMQLSFEVLASMVVNPVKTEADQFAMIAYPILHSIVWDTEFHGYSVFLMETLWEWFTLSVDMSEDVSLPKIANDIRELQMIQKLAELQAVRTRALYRPSQCDVDMATLAPVPVNDIPAMWATAEELMPKAVSLARDEDPDLNDIDLPIKDSGLSKVIGLRYGQYEVVEFIGVKGEEYLFKNVPVTLAE